MSKILAVMIAGLFAAGAYAQNPTGTTHEQGNATNSKPQARAEAKKEANPAGKVAAPAGDIAKTPEGCAIGTDKAAASGENLGAREIRAESPEFERGPVDGSLQVIPAKMSARSAAARRRRRMNLEL